MAFFVNTGPSPRSNLAAQLGLGAGKFLQQRAEEQQKQKQQSALAKALFPGQEEQFSNLPLEAQLQIAKFQTDQQTTLSNLQEKFKKEQALQEQSGILADYAEGKEVTPERRRKLTPQQQLSIIRSDSKAAPGGLSGQPVPQEISQAIPKILNENKEASADDLKAAFDAAGIPPAYTNQYVENRRQSTKPTFEPTEERLEAERVSKIADEISKDYQSAQTEDLRLDRMEKLAEKGNLSTPMMVKALDVFGLPLGILGNPDTEEFSKLEADFVRDVSKIFPGQIRVFEIQAYLRTVPGLMNSPEGQKAIIHNRRLLNEAKRVKHDEYKKILNENGGRKPRNLDLLLEERTSERINDIGERFRNGVESALEKQLPKMKMYDQQGKSYDIPSHLVPQAQKQGLIFR